MIKKLYRHIIQFLEEYKINGLFITINEFFYFNREAIIIEKDLLSLKPLKNYQLSSNIKFLEIARHNFEEINPKYFFKSRYLRALECIGNGYRSFAIMKGDEVLGDVWYSSKINTRRLSIHPDLKLCEIDIGERNVYSFGLHTKPEERVNLVGFKLLTYALDKLRGKGFNKVYGLIFADNIPALLMFRKFGYKEVKRVKICRFILFLKRM
jgi:GNAT superfamily N-acetyltransferase